MVGSEWGVGEVLWTMIWFTLLFIWIWIAISVLVDVFRSHDLGGFAKFLWVVFIFVVPFLGVFVYLIARGNKMSKHAQQDAEQMEAARRNYIRDAVGGAASPAAELERLATLKQQGVIDEAEFQRLTPQVVGG
ncbi:MAG: PLDc N-terminal domain-containing protein [Actinomycetota bacterium]